MMHKPRHLLILPRLRIQNANAISAPLTWGFPAMTALTGFMQALERRLPDELYLQLEQIGVVSHGHEIQSSPVGYNEQQFHLTRNPINNRKYLEKDGGTKVPAIVEEGRMHMDISLMLAVGGGDGTGDDLAGQNLQKNAEELTQIARDIDVIVHGMRIAGGSVMPRADIERRPRLVSLPDDSEDYDREFQKIRRQLLPGFALVLNEQALAERLAACRHTDPDTSPLDAWLDFARLHHDCLIDEEDGTHAWQIRRRSGWQVPIPVGYKSLSAHEPGTVANARDPHIPFHFVESIYSIGQWVSPHRLPRPESLLWYVDNDLDNGIYRLNNDYIRHNH